MDYQKESRKIINWIQERFDASSLENIIIGMSGGIDSSLSATLAVNAVGKERIIPVLMPYGTLSAEGVKDAQMVIEHLDIPQTHVVVRDIQPSVDAVIANLKENISDVRRGNIMARVRMIYLFDTAKKYNGMVCGTENKSEHYLGYYTRFGDEASDIEPIRHLYKTNVWEMAKRLHIPEKVIAKAPTAGLWQGQTDEDELGFSYKDADTVLRYYIDEKLSTEEIVQKGIDEHVVKKVVDRVKAIEFKHTLPYVFSKS